MLAASIGAGFLGGILSGFLAGYSTALLNKYIKLPTTLEGLKPVLILPVLGSLVVRLLSPIPNTVTNLGLYVVAILVGTLVTTGMFFLLKRPAAQRLVRAEAAAAGE